MEQKEEHLLRAWQTVKATPHSVKALTHVFEVFLAKPVAIPLFCTLLDSANLFRFAWIRTHLLVRFFAKIYKKHKDAFMRCSEKEQMVFSEIFDTLFTKKKGYSSRKKKTVPLKKCPLAPVSFPINHL